MYILIAKVKQKYQKIKRNENESMMVIACISLSTEDYQIYVYILELVKCWYTIEIVIEILKQRRIHIKVDRETISNDKILPWEVF